MNAENIETIERHYTYLAQVMSEAGVKIQQPTKAEVLAGAAIEALAFLECGQVEKAKQTLKRATNS